MDYTAYLERYAVQTVGSKRHQEYWIPAEDLSAFNEHMVGVIEIVAQFGGSQSSTATRGT